MGKTLYSRNINLGDTPCFQPKCIAYKIPPHEIENARRGVPMEELEKLSEPGFYVPPAETQKLRPKRGAKGRFE